MVFTDKALHVMTTNKKGVDTHGSEGSSALPQPLAQWLLGTQAERQTVMQQQRSSSGDIVEPRPSMFESRHG